LLSKDYSINFAALNQFGALAYVVTECEAEKTNTFRNEEM